MADREESESGLARRVAELEGTVSGLQRRLAALEAGAPIGAPAGAPMAAAGAHEETAAAQHASMPGADAPASGHLSPPLSLDVFSTTREARAPRSPTIVAGDPGQWTGRLGIALLLLGAAFGFKYSIDRGWIGPALRVAMGLGLGGLLVAASTRVRDERPGLARMLAGGGIGACWLSVYAAYQFYGLLGHAAAFAAMSLVTASAWVLSLREDDEAVATLATGVGFATPFLLASGSGSATGLVLYACLVTAGAAAVFARSGWGLLLRTSAVGAWLLLAVAASDLVRGSTPDALAVQAGMIAVALATWGLAVAREVHRASREETGRAGTPPDAALDCAPHLRTVPSSPGAALPGLLSFGSVPSHELALATPVVALFVTASAWSLGDAGSGRAALLLAALWAAVAAWMHARATAAPQGDEATRTTASRQADATTSPHADATASLHTDAPAPPARGRAAEVARSFASTHVAAAAVMVAFALSFLCGDDTRRIGLAVEAAALLAVAARAGGAWPALVGHALFAFVALETAGRLVEAIDRAWATFGLVEIADLAVLASLAAGGCAATAATRPLLFAAAEVGLLLWVQAVLGPLGGGAALVTAAWFANAVALVVAGLRLDSDATRRAGAAVMALTMAKLFVHDLATVDPFWRIVVFVGFGLVLLGLGYVFPALWKRADPPAADA